MTNAIDAHHGWIPGPEAYSPALLEEERWLEREVAQRSVTELEILHAVLNNPDMAGRAFFYFRDPKYVESVPADKKVDFTTKNAEVAAKFKELKNRIRAKFGIPPSGGPATAYAQNSELPPPSRFYCLADCHFAAIQ